jgi:hypothetical protein
MFKIFPEAVRGSDLGERLLYSHMGSVSGASHFSLVGSGVRANVLLGVDSGVDFLCIC